MGPTMYDHVISALRRAAFGRMRPARLALQALALTLSLLLAVSPASADDAACIDAMMKNYGRLVKAWGKDIGDCLKSADVSGNPTAEACSTADLKGRIAKATQKLLDEAVGGIKDKCNGMTPPFGYTDTTTNIDAARESMLGLAHQIFGDPLDVLNAGGNKELTACRQILWKGTAKMANAMLKEWRRCVKQAIASGANSDEELQQACFAGPGPLDPKGRVEKLNQAMKDKLFKANCTGGVMLAAHDGSRPTAVEYAVMLALIIAIVLAAIAMLGGMQKGTLGTNNPFLADQWDDGAVNNSHLVGVKSDLYVGNYFDNDRVCANDGTGAFLCGPVTEPAHSTNAVALGDFNTDSKMDALIATDVPSNRRCINTAPGGDFSCSDYGTGVVVNNDVALGTIDAGSVLDAVVATPLGAYKCMNGLACSPLGFPSPETSNAVGVALGDVNGDGTLDAVFANSSARDRYCTFSPIIVIPGVYDFICGDVSPDTLDSRKVALGDLNGDRRLDAVFARFGTPNQVCLRLAGGGFSCHNVSGETGFFFDVAIGDLDGDSDRDLLFAKSDLAGAKNRQCTNDGSANFTCKDVSADVGNFTAVAVGDLDGDGDLDAVFGDAGAANLRCFNTAGNFSCSPVEAHSAVTNDVALNVGLPPPPPTQTPTMTATHTPTSTPLP